MSSNEYFEIIKEHYIKKADSLIDEIDGNSSIKDSEKIATLGVIGHYMLQISLHEMCKVNAIEMLNRVYEHIKKDIDGKEECNHGSISRETTSTH